MTDPTQATLPTAAEPAEPEPPDRRPTLLLVDGYGLIFRAYHAVPTGIATSARRAGQRRLRLRLDAARRAARPSSPSTPSSPSKAARHSASEEYADYKAHRGAMPDDLRPQVARIRELIDALNIPIEEREGYEADDVIGSLCRPLQPRRRPARPDRHRRQRSAPARRRQRHRRPARHPALRRVARLRPRRRRAALRLRPGARRRLQGARRRHLRQHPRRARHRREDRQGADRPVRPGRGDPRSTSTRSRRPAPAPRIAANDDLARQSKRLATIVRDLDIPIDLEHSRDRQLRPRAGDRALPRAGVPLPRQPAADRRPDHAAARRSRPPSARRPQRHIVRH